jgi:hypothetical protein
MHSNTTLSFVTKVQKLLKSQCILQCCSLMRRWAAGGKASERFSVGKNCTIKSQGSRGHSQETREFCSEWPLSASSMGHQLVQV